MGTESAQSQIPTQSHPPPPLPSRFPSRVRAHYYLDSNTADAPVNVWHCGLHVLSTASHISVRNTHTLWQMKTGRMSETVTSKDCRRRSDIGFAFRHFPISPRPGPGPLSPRVGKQQSVFAHALITEIFDVQYWRDT